MNAYLHTAPTGWTVIVGQDLDGTASIPPGQLPGNPHHACVRPEENNFAGTRDRAASTAPGRTQKPAIRVPRANSRISLDNVIVHG
jgi:hypothetical protein